MNALLIMNPGSRSRRGQALWSTWTDGLRRAGVPFDTVVTQAPGHAIQLAREARGFDTVVAVGGDGTINEVLDGLMQTAPPRPRMGVLYSGTSPDFCRFHGIPIEPLAAVRALAADRPACVDTVLIAFHDATGRPVTAHFGCGCNIGLGAEVARRANRIRRWIGDGPGTAWALLRALWISRPVDLELSLDGSPCPLAAVNHLFILKNPFVASGLRLDLDLRPDDGRLEVVGICGKSRAELLRLAPDFYTGRAMRRPGLWRRSVTRLTVRSADRREIEFDGDPRGFLPVEIEVRPRGLQLLGTTHA